MSAPDAWVFPANRVNAVATRLSVVGCRPLLGKRRRAYTKAEFWDSGSWSHLHVHSRARVIKSWEVERGFFARMTSPQILRGDTNVVEVPLEWEHDLPTLR